jgi:hypothetical protein
MGIPRRSCGPPAGLTGAEVTDLIWDLNGNTRGLAGHVKTTDGHCDTTSMTAVLTSR